MEADQEAAGPPLGVQQSTGLPPLIKKGGGVVDEDRSYQKIKSPTDQVRYEFTNQDTVVLRKSGVYYKVVGNSAVILKILGAKTKIRSGYNSSFEQEVLEMSLHSKNIGDIKEYLETMSSKVLRDDGLFYIVRLKTPIGAKRIRRARGSNELKEEIARDILIKRRLIGHLAQGCLPTLRGGTAQADQGVVVLFQR